MPRDVAQEVQSLSNIGRMVHLAARFDQVDEQRIQAELLTQRKRAYEDELSIQAERAGCGPRRARLGNNASLTALSEASKRDAASITNTYNYDLAVAIQAIRTEVPRANRFTYAKRLRDWEAARNRWKIPQIAQWTEASARTMAQRDFVAFNDARGEARLIPESAKEPICQGIIRRGWMPMATAMQFQVPVHINCPHIWQTRYRRLNRSECNDLWMGQ